MKKYISVFLAIGLVLSLGTIAMAGMTPGTGIQGTYHDLSSINVNGVAFTDDGTVATGGKDRICVYCHAPHASLKPLDADPSFDYLPLWNHAATTLVNAFTPYENGGFLPGLADHQFNGIDSIGQPGGVSLLCLSCHDGSVAVNEYGFYGSLSKGGPSATPPRAAKNISTKPRAVIGGGGDLTNHHPIGFIYDDVAAIDKEIRFSTACLPGAGACTDGAGGGGVLAGGPTTIGELLANDMMECVTCHDVHNTKNGGTKFTWVDDQYSNFCFTCHMKDGQTDQTVGYSY